VLVNGVALCQMFNAATSAKSVQKYISSDSDPPFQTHRWQANLRILEIQEIKSFPYVPLSCPFLERLIGTIRREFLNQIHFRDTSDLDQRWRIVATITNAHRVPTALESYTQSEISGETAKHRARLSDFRWRFHCRGPGVAVLLVGLCSRKTIPARRKKAQAAFRRLREH
jgi:putative transposase